MPSVASTARRSAPRRVTWAKASRARVSRQAGPRVTAFKHKRHALLSSGVIAVANPKVHPRSEMATQTLNAQSSRNFPIGGKPTDAGPVMR